MMEAETGFKIRRSGERGHFNHGWLKTWHSFSFGAYQDPAHQGYRQLRVINEDRIAPGRGFGMHPHESMEIFTFVVSGQLKHEDSMGNSRIIEAGEFQYMSAGSGVLHSEVNPSAEEETHLLQIWIFPEQAGGDPAYADLDPRGSFTDGELTLLASSDGAEGSIKMRQQASIYYGKLSAGRRLTTYALPGRPHLWLQLISGSLEICGQRLVAGDALSKADGVLSIESAQNAEFLLFQLA